jgi:hypothetical protein
VYKFVENSRQIVDIYGKIYAKVGKINHSARKPRKKV